MGTFRSGDSIGRSAGGGNGAVVPGCETTVLGSNTANYKKRLWLAVWRGGEPGGGFARRIRRRFVRIAKLDQSRSALQPGRKIADERFHRRVPESVEAEEVHFVDGLLRRPAVVRHAIGGDEHAGAVVPEAAVHKDFPAGIFAEKRQESGDLIVRRRRPAAYGNADKTDAESLGLLSFPGNLAGIFTAQVDDGGDAELLQLFQAFRARLRAAKKRIVDLSAIGKSVELQFFAVSGTDDGSAGSPIRSLRFEPNGKKSGKAEDSGKKQMRARLTHIELDAKSLARVFLRAAQRKCACARATAPLDIDIQEKKIPDFAFFS